jgi:hypothetical protein
MYLYVHVVSRTYDVYLYKSGKALMVVKGGLSVRNMNRWNKQHVAGWARANRTGWATGSGMKRESVIKKKISLSERDFFRFF